MKKLVLSNENKLSAKELISSLYQKFEYVYEAYSSIFIFNEGKMYMVKMFDFIGMVIKNEPLELEEQLTCRIDTTRAIQMQLSCYAKSIAKPKPVIEYDFIDEVEDFLNEEEVEIEEEDLV